MKISKFIHSCLLVEKGADKILFDPGKFSFVEGAVQPEQFQNLSAIILTHRHPDHLDDNALAAIVKNNPSATVLANTEIQEQLKGIGITATKFEDGQRSLGSFQLAAFDAPHANILNAAPPQNTAYLVDEIFLHPGDSFAASLTAQKRTRVLALPVMAPWTTELQVAEFALNMSPQQIIPIHDGFAKDFFLEIRYDNYTKYFKQHSIEFQWMNKPGDFLEVEI